MRVIQLVDNISYGDAIGNHVAALDGVFNAAGIRTELYANRIDKRFPKGTAKPVRKLKHVKKEDIIIYHMSSGTPLNREWVQWDCYRVMMYHNITPPHFFRPYSRTFANILRSGLEDVLWLKDYVHECWVSSKYNRQDLLNLGYSDQQIRMMPGYLIPFEDYISAGQSVTNHLFDDGRTNVLFVGRLAPNKKQEDVIRSFAFYKERYDLQARLILIGSETLPGYAADLRTYVQNLHLEDVVFLGHVSFQDIVSCYQTAKVFVCLSEHEGFCIPLVEAMFFHIPVLAFGAGAVEGTLGGGGVVIDNKNPAFVAKWIDRLVKDDTLRGAVIGNQKRRLLELQNDVVADAFQKRIKEIERERMSS